MIYLDAAASSLKPKSVIEAQKDFLENHYANAGRGVCERANYVDNMVSDARNKMAEFIGAKSSSQIVFTSGTTDGINRIVNILKVSKILNKDTVVLVSDLDHHSARLPWEEQACLGNCKISVCNLDNKFNLDLSNVKNADVFIITAMSNVLGTPQDIAGLIAHAKQINPNVITIVDCAQYVVHLPVDVSEWNCDFLCFSGHKIGADTGIGIMYIKEPNRWHVDKLGGGMVSVVNAGIENNGATSQWILAEGSDKYEAGTLPLTQIAGLSFAIYDLKLNKNNHKLIKYLYDELSEIGQIKILSESDAYILTFIIDGMHPLDFGALIGAHGICVRVGNMCASWIHNLFGVKGTIRISVGSWNTIQEIQETVEIIKKILKV